MRVICAPDSVYSIMEQMIVQGSRASIPKPSEVSYGRLERFCSEMVLAEGLRSPTPADYMPLSGSTMWNWNEPGSGDQADGDSTRLVQPK
jgi:hypothetical protein